MANSVLALTMAALLKRKPSRRSSAAVSARADNAEKGHSAQPKTVGEATADADSGDDNKDGIAALHTPAVATQRQAKLLPRVGSRTQREPLTVAAPAGATLAEGDPPDDGSQSAAALGDGRSQEAGSVPAADEQLVQYQPDEGVADQDSNHDLGHPAHGSRGHASSPEVIPVTAQTPQRTGTLWHIDKIGDAGGAASLDGGETMLSSPADVVMVRPAQQQSMQRQRPAPAKAPAALLQELHAAATTAQNSPGQTLGRSPDQTAGTTGRKTTTIIRPRLRLLESTQAATGLGAATFSTPTPSQLPEDAPRQMLTAAGGSTAAITTGQRTVVNRKTGVPAPAASGTLRTIHRAAQQPAGGQLSPGAGHEAGAATSRAPAFAATARPAQHRQVAHTRRIMTQPAAAVLKRTRSPRVTMQTPSQSHDMGC